MLPKEYLECDQWQIHTEVCPWDLWDASHPLQSLPKCKVDSNSIEEAGTNMQPNSELMGINFGRSTRAEITRRWIRTIDDVYDAAFRIAGRSADLQYYQYWMRPLA